VPDVLISASDVSKAFGGIRALHRVDMDVARGEVHGLIGPNGSGKSTLMKIFAGLYRADDGNVTLGGETLRGGIAGARKLGVTIVPQEITLVPGLSVADNVVLGADPARWGMRTRTVAKRAVRRVLDDVGCEVDPDELVKNIIPTQRRLIMIAAALQRGAETLILDEPTAGLAAEEIHHVTTAIERLKSSGRTFILVSHRLDELIALSDRITVLREGQVVGRFLDRKAERSELIRLIAPTHEIAQRPIATTDVSVAGSSTRAGEVLLTVDELALGSLRSLTFQARRGECVGVVGGVGSGLRELAESMSGVQRAGSGTIRTRNGISIRSTSDALRGGLLFISGERHRFVIPDRSVGFHVCLPSLPSRSVKGFVSPRRENAAAALALRSVGVTAEIAQTLGSLSGGNQQRALFARAALGGPEIIAIYEPSVGVDVVGRELLREHIRTMRNERAVVLMSSDPEELAGLCDRVICLRNGAISSVLTSDEVTMQAMFDGIS
jgi:ribose transport system ATP-binding protein